MNILSKVLLGSLTVAVASATNAATGESWKSPGSLSAGKSVTVKLVNEKNLDWDSEWDDPEDKYTGYGVYYLKISCSKSKAPYTVWTTGLSADDCIEFSIDDPSQYDWDADGYSSWFSDISAEYNYRGDDYYYALEEVDEDDPSSLTYYIYLGGEIGQQVTVGFKQGLEKPPVSYGDVDNPRPITVSSADAKYSDLLLEDGCYYLTAKLESGKKYKFWTTGGTADFELSLSKPSIEEGESPDCRKMTGLAEGNQGWIVVPAETGTYVFCVSGEEDQAFTFNYGMISARTPDKHPATDVGTPTATGFVDEECQPGFRNNPNSGYFDGVIDEVLYKVKLVKGETYAFETVGADLTGIPLRMEIYDAKGNVVEQNGFKMSVSGSTRSDNDCVLSYTCTTAGNYWVGVCEAGFYDEEDYDEELDEPSYESVTFSARKVTAGVDGQVDAWDPKDDNYTGTGFKATGLTPGMGEYISHGPHTFGLADSADWFSVAARSGLTYSFKSELDETAEEYDARMSGVKLQATVYTSKGKVFGSVIEDLAAGGSFTASENATYYVCVRPDRPAGQDYGPYSLLCKASGGEGLGALTICIGGTDAGRWQVTAPVKKGVTEPQYEGGQTVFLDPANNPYTIGFATVKGWSAPATIQVNVVADETLVLTNKYSDDCDVLSNDAVLGDGSKTGKKVTTLKPARAETSVSRSLWHEDAADWFKVAVVANTYYRFALVDDAALGDAEITVYRENGADVVACGAAVEFLCRESKANYYVAVGHATQVQEDAQYTMTYSSTAVGAISFAKTAVSAKDTDASVTLTVNRSAKEGRVRVRYTTFADTALPGVNYEPVEGWLEWADGDNKAKTIVIPLIPDLVAKWEPDRTFTVQLATVPFEELHDDEYMPALSSTKATVTIAEATKKTTGTINLIGYGDTCEEFATPKKPAVSMPAGETLSFWFERADGSDGKVAVTVTPTKGTAVADEHFDATPQTLVWESGETEAKCFVLTTYATDEAYMSAKTLTLKVAADKTVSSDTAKISTSSVAVTLNDPKVTQTVESYAASFGKSDGITVKAGKTDTWYFDEIGDLRSVTPAVGGKAEITVTLNGPGRFVCRPTFLADAETISTCTVTIGKEKTPIKLVPGEETEIRRYFAKGSTTVKFTLTRTKPSGKQTNVPSDDDMALVFADMGDGDPFAWKLLPAAELVMPLAGEVVVGAASCACTPEQEPGTVELRWSDAEDSDIVYLFTLASDKKNLGTAKAEFPVEALAENRKFVKVVCTDCIEGKLPPGEIGSGKTYYWRVDTTFADEDCAITNVSGNVWTLNPLDCGNPQALITSGMDAYGNVISEIEKDGSTYPVKLVQGVCASMAFGGEKESCGEMEPLEGATFALVKGSTLPTGLTLKNGVISGSPSKAGTFTSIVQVSYKATGARVATAGGTVTLKFDIEPLNLAVGTFNGIVSTDDERFQQDDEGLLPAEASSRFGALAVTVADSGKISAKVSLANGSYSFSAANWGATTVLDNGQPGVAVVITNVTKFTTSKTKTTAAQTVWTTNVLLLTACRGAADDAEAADVPMTASLMQSFLATDKISVLADVAYAGEAARDNRKEAALLAEQAPFVGYYTVALFPQTVEYYLTGYGYLTLTIDAKGVAKVAGVLADGSTKISASAVAAYVAEDAETGNPALSIPLYSAKGKYAFGGTIVLRLDEKGVPYVDGTTYLSWINTDATATYDGEDGFMLDLEPVGGYYNTLYNLQAYYLNSRLRVGEVDMIDLPDELLGDNEKYVCRPGQFSEYLTVLGNTISMAKQVKVTREVTVGKKTVKLTDWENSVNPANLTFSMKSATGIFSGSFDMYAGNDSDEEGLEREQVKLGSFKHQGVLLMARDSGSPALPESEVAMAGSWNAAVPVSYEDASGNVKTRKFNACLPFVIVPEEKEQPWADSTWVEVLPTVE